MMNSTKTNSSRVCCMEHFAEMVHDHYVGTPVESVGIIADYEYIVYLLEELIRLDDMCLYSIDLVNPSVNGYNGYFVLIIDGDGIWVEKIEKLESGDYTGSAGDVLYIHQDVNSRVLKSQEYDTVIEFSIDTMDDDFEPTYMVNGKEVSKEEYGKAAADIQRKFDDFDEKMTNEVQNFLMKQLSFRKEFNTLLEDFFEKH